MNEAIKDKVLSLIAGPNGYVFIGKSKYRLGKQSVHVRFCSANRNTGLMYKFNINPNTLSADFELWICGNTETFYLVPVTVIKDIYSNPNTYVDRHHPDIRVVSVDTERHLVMYARGGQSKDIRKYLKMIISE